MQSIKDLINNKDEKYIKSMVDRHKYVTTEYQDYGYRIALQLGQTDKISLYIKIAKEKPRALVEQAFSFAIDYPNAKNKGRLFMWKLKELEKESDERNGNVDKKIVKRKKKKSDKNVSEKITKKAEKKDISKPPDNAGSNHREKQSVNKEEGRSTKLTPQKEEKVINKNSEGRKTNFSKKETLNNTSKNVN